MKKKSSLVCLLILIVLVVSACGGSKYTLEMFDKIENDMTYEQVIEILGEGEVLSSTKITDIETIMYGWANEDGSNMNIMLQNDKVISKAQFGLK
ncbi:DUF3862 domain-containing protein [Anaerosolibacter sp.]|uniref:DUF3862 domain-containing protein n=1 Tax=Anaerosolibacter sp. TaxID=1872527 RepID=UPI0039EF159A